MRPNRPEQRSGRQTPTFSRRVHAAWRYLDNRPGGEELGRMIVAAAVIGVALVGVVWWLGTRNDETIARVAELVEVRQQEIARLLELQQEMSALNLTGESISVWVREDSRTPRSPGESISGLHDVICSGPECGISRNGVTRFTVQRDTDDPEALMAINAWTNSGEIVYSAHRTQRQMDIAGWHIRIEDQRP